MKHYQIRQSITDRSSLSVNLYLKDIAKYPLLTEEEEKLLIQQFPDPKAKELLIKSNLRFVVSIAKQYQGKGVDFADLISAGNMGLIKAIDQFDLNFGFRFLSYAVWWIRDYILKEIQNNGKTIRIPAGKITFINKINKFITEYEQKYGQPPTDDIIAQMLGIEDFNVQNLMSNSIVIIPDTIVNKDGEEESIFDTLHNENENTDKSLQFKSITVEIIDVLKRNLNQTEFEIITELFGINVNPLSLDEIGIKHNITKERVRQIKDKAIIKLRKSSDILKLSKYFE